jgi:hypothetical protein
LSESNSGVSLFAGSSTKCCGAGCECSVGISIGGGTWFFDRRRRIKKSARSAINRIAPAATPTPTPALAPVESPDEPDDSVEVEDAAAALVEPVVVPIVAALVVVAVLVAGVLLSVDCHRI